MVLQRVTTYLYCWIYVFTIMGAIGFRFIVHPSVVEGQKHFLDWSMSVACQILLICLICPLRYFISVMFL